VKFKRALLAAAEHPVYRDDTINGNRRSLEIWDGGVIKVKEQKLETKDFVYSWVDSLLCTDDVYSEGWWADTRLTILQ